VELQFNFPPGVFKNGTDRQAAGRWGDANLVRWYQEETRPVGGWSPHSGSTVTGAARALLTWRDNQSNSWIAIGSNANLYVMNRAGALYDITPAGYTAGRADATFGTGYGGGTYGGGTYGTPRPDTTNILDATVWSLDTFGQNLVGVTPDDRTMYGWTAPTTGTIAAPLANAPSASALVVTQERFLMALGTADPRTVSWCDQQNNTVWTASATNQAGSFPLQTFGRIMCGKRINSSTGIWTDVDFWVASYIGQPLVYAFTKIASGCGACSRQAVAATSTQAAWMGTNGFWLYDQGTVQPLPSDVQDYVFSDINRTQISKVHAVLNSQFGEVWWFYPSAASNEIDRYVIWNYRENHWSIGKLCRYSGADAGGAFTFPIMVGVDGVVYEHETGFAYPGLILAADIAANAAGDTIAANAGGDSILAQAGPSLATDPQFLLPSVPYCESGPVEFAPVSASYSGQGARVFQANAFIPDERLSGDVSLTVKGRVYPNGPETVLGPLAIKPQTDVRITGRQVKIRLTGVRNDDWRFGHARMEIKGQGNR